MTYVTEQTSSELRTHMRRLKAMSGWHEPLADRLYAEILEQDAEIKRLRDTPASTASMPGLPLVARLYTQGRYQRASVDPRHSGVALTYLNAAAEWRQIAELRQQMIDDLIRERDAAAKSESERASTASATTDEQRQYFVYSPENGVDWYDSEAEARAAAQEEIDCYRKEAQKDGEWSSEVERICWGVTLGRTAAVEMPDEANEGGETPVDYALAAPTTQPTGQDAAKQVARIAHLRTDRARRIYVAGPMTGLPEFNFPAFNAKAVELRAEGWHVENPAEHGLVEGATYEDYLRWDISRIATCGAIYLLPGWENSKGARLEVTIGSALGVQFLGEPIKRAAVEPSQPAAEPTKEMIAVMLSEWFGGQWTESWDDRAAAAWKAACKVLAASRTPAPAAPTTCVWTLEDDDSGMWATGCGEAFMFTDGGPKENSSRYCCYCGGSLVAAIASSTKAT